MLTVVGGLVTKAGNTLLSMTADCGQLTAWRAHKRPLLDDYTQYQAATATMESSAPPSESIAQTCATLRASGEKFVADSESTTKANVEKVLTKVKINETAFVGVLAEEPTACYAGMIQKMHTEADTDKTQLIVFAITIVKNKSIFLYRFAAYANSDSVTETLGRMKADVAALYKANN